MRRSLLFAIALLLALPAAAQVQRTFVASYGLDSNPCSRVAPCRGFSAAVAAVNFGGEVVVIDSAGYGPVTIDKSVSIVAPPGVYAGITATSGDAVTINAIYSKIVLRGISLTGKGATNGINVAGSAEVFVDRCVIQGFIGPGVRFVSGYSVVIDDTVARNNGYGFYIAPSSGTVTGSLDRCAVESSTYAGVEVDGIDPGTKVGVHDTVSANNGTAGFYGYAAQLYLKRCISVGNIDGVLSANGATVAVADCQIAHNVNALHNAGSTLLSFGNNELGGNGSATFGTVTTIPTQ